MSSTIDGSDHDAIEKQHETYVRKLVKLRMKIRSLEDLGDEKALEKAKESFREHLKKGSKLKTKAEESNYFWP